MSTLQITPLESGNRIQLPADWAKAFGLQGQVALDKTAEGILIRPCPPSSWQELFATKLTIGSAPPDENEAPLEVTGDDFLF